MTVTFSVATRAKLAHLADMIESYPRRFNMETWISGVDQKATRNVIIDDACNTAGCIAGWALSEFLPADEVFKWSVYSTSEFSQRALELLEVPDATPEAYFLHDMFVSEKWWSDHDYIPEKWTDDYDEEHDSTLADVTADIAIQALYDLANGEWQ